MSVPNGSTENAEDPKRRAGGLVPLMVLFGPDAQAPSPQGFQESFGNLPGYTLSRRHASFAGVWHNPKEDAQSGSRDAPWARPAIKGTKGVREGVVGCGRCGDGVL